MFLSARAGASCFLSNAKQREALQANFISPVRLSVRGGRRKKQFKNQNAKSKKLRPMARFYPFEGPKHFIPLILLKTRALF